MKITVFHPHIPGNGQSTEFEGANLDYRVEEDGHLRVWTWETDTARGDALFAAGTWTYVCRTKPASDMIQGE